MNNKNISYSSSVSSVNELKSLKINKMSYP
jgi:hypothetical protein